MPSLLLILLVLLTPVLQSIAQSDPATEPSVIAVAKAMPAVVNINTERVVQRTIRDPRDDLFFQFFGGPMQRPRVLSQKVQSLGSGFIIDSSGYLVTNEHVVERAAELKISVTTHDGKTYSARYIAGSTEADLALLKIDSPQPLPFLALTDLSPNLLGQTVLVLGNPLGYGSSVARGILSAKDRSVAIGETEYKNLLQTDAAINPGNSGGPLFNLAGEVVGVNAQIFSRTGGFMGLSFAIPIDVAMNVYRQLRDKGVVSRGWLGVLIQDVTGELAESFKMTTPRGALISKVLPAAPAAAAGIQAGDVIIKFNGADISLATDLPPLVGATSVGQNIPVEILRDGKSRQITVTIGQLPESEPQAGGSTDKPKPAVGQFEEQLKIRIRALSDAERREMEIKGPGVVVDKIKPGPAAQAGLLVGDILAQLNFKEIKTPQDLAAALKSVPPGTKVPLLIYREGNPLFLALEIPKA